MPRALAGALLLACAASAQAAAVVRVACDDDNSDAEITINGQFKGECPVDIQLPAGNYLLRALKKVGDGRIRDFEQSLRVADGTAKKITVQLSEPYLTPEAQAQRQRRDAEYEPLLEKSLREKAAAADNEVTMFKRSAAYARASQADIAAVSRILALPRGPVRRVATAGEANVQALIATDPFFALPTEGRSFVEDFVTVSPDQSVETASHLSGIRHERVFELKRSNQNKFGVVEEAGRAALAGLLPMVRTYRSKSWSWQDTLSGIDWLEGQPFPLTQARRFAMQYIVTSENQSKVYHRFVCGVTDQDTESQAIAAQAGEPVTPLICMTQRIDTITIQRLYVGNLSGYGFHPRRSIAN